MHENKHPLRYKKRYDYLDALKTLAMIFVCSYHFSWIGNAEYSADGMTKIVLLNRFILGLFSCCIPIFFMVNGALMLNKEQLNYRAHFKKIANLYFKICIWRALTILIFSYTYKISLSGIDKFNLFNAIFLFSYIDNFDFSHFWFMDVLLCIYILYPLIFSTFQSNKISIVVGFLITMFFIIFVVYEYNNLWVLSPFLEKIYINGLSNLNPFSGLVGCMLFYFSLGWLIHKYKDKIVKLPYWFSCVMFLLGAGILFWEWYMISKNMQYNWDSVYCGYSSIGTLLMSVFIYVIICKLYININSESIFMKFIRVIGKNTLSVYFVHWIVGYTILDSIHEKIFFNKTGILVNFMKGILIVLSISVASELIKTIKSKLFLKFHNTIQDLLVQSK